jgi:hypothetical protein
MQTYDSIRALFEKQRLSKPSREQKIFIAVYLLVGLAGLTAALVLWVVQHSFPTLFLLVGLPYTALGSYFVADLRNERDCAQKMLHALDHDGESIAWVYIENESGQHEACILHYCFTDRRHGTFYDTPVMVRELFDFLSRAYPQISTGYSAELAKRFRCDPHSLRSAPLRTAHEKHTVVDSPASNGW